MTRRLTAALVVVNLVGVLLYLWGASHAWAIPEERAAGITTLTSEPFIWAGFVFPVWTTFAVVNLAWVAVAVARRWWRSLGLLVAVGAMWAAVVVDFAHH